MPVYVAEGEKVRHLDESCDKLDGKKPERKNNTPKLQADTERCAECFTDEAMKKPHRKKPRNATTATP